MWIEHDWITRSHQTIGDRWDEFDSVRIHKKEVHAPATCRVRLHVVEELPMASLDQAELEGAPIALSAEMLASPGVAQATVIEIGGEVLFENPPDQVCLREFDRDEIAEEKVGKGREIVLGHDGIYADDPESMFQKYLSRGFGSDRRSFVNQCRPNRYRAPGSMLAFPALACRRTIARYMTAPVVHQTGGRHGKRRFLVPEVQHAGAKFRG
jgi:hypothetical protein